LREEHRLRVFENGVLREIYGVKRDEVVGKWRRLHNEKLHGLQSSPNFIRLTEDLRDAHSQKIKIHTLFRCENTNQKVDLENLYIDGRIRLTVS
jgi:hypothetical protein